MADDPGPWYMFVMYDEYSTTVPRVAAAPSSEQPETGAATGREGNAPNIPNRTVALMPEGPGGCGVDVDLGVLVEECSRVISERPRDGSPPMVALSADVVRAVAEYARTLRLGVGLQFVEESRRHAPISPDEMRWREFAARGPVVGGDGAADAWGSVVHPVHISMVRPGAVTYPLLRLVSLSCEGMEIVDRAGSAGEIAGDGARFDAVNGQIEGLLRGEHGQRLGDAIRELAISVSLVRGPS